jgi:hypothetical protein
VVAPPTSGPSAAVVIPPRPATRTAADGVSAFFGLQKHADGIYFGWRERGNFGVKPVFHRTPETLKP